MGEEGGAVWNEVVRGSVEWDGGSVEWDGGNVEWDGGSVE